MRKVYVALVVLALAVGTAGIFLLYYSDTLSALKHETDRWAVIRDRDGDHIAVEPTSDKVWSQLVQLCENESERWIGSIVQEYDNKWGFRFKPENVTVAEYTIEGAQTSIRSIGEDLNYWLDFGWAYVWAKVTEVHDAA